MEVEAVDEEVVESVQSVAVVEEVAVGVEVLIGMRTFMTCPG